MSIKMSGKKFIMAFLSFFVVSTIVLIFVNQDGFLKNFSFDESTLLDDVHKEIAKFSNDIENHPLTQQCQNFQSELLTKSGVPTRLEKALSLAFCLCTTEALKTTSSFEQITTAAQAGMHYDTVVKNNYKTFKSYTRHCSKPSSLHN